MRAFPFFFLFFLLFLIPSVSGNYTSVGVDQEYRGNTLFNSGLNELSFTTEGTLDSGSPLVADLDGDGKSEMIVFEDGQLNVYLISPPTLLGNVDVSALGGGFKIQQPIIIDADQDGVQDIIFPMIDVGTALVHIIRATWNGSLMNWTNLHAFPTEGGTFDQAMLTCRFDDTFRCLIVQADGIWFNSHLWLRAFNLTANGTMNTFFSDTGTHDMACLPSIPSIAFADWDNDGTSEYVFSWMEVGPAARDEVFHISAFTINSSLAVLNDDDITENVGSFIADATPDCRVSNYGTSFTSVYLANIDDISSNGLEAVIGHLESATTFKMRSYTSVGAGSEFDDYPELVAVSGTALGNIVEADIFDVSGRVDFCVNALTPGSNVTFLCASEQIGETLGLGDSDSFTGDMPYPPSFTYPRNDHHIQSVTRPGGNDVILSLYGTHFLNTGTTTHALDYQIPQNDISLVMARVDGSSQNDIVGFTATNIWFFDDNFLSGCGSNGCIDEIFYNPCIEQTWKLNTTSEVRAVLTDVDSTSVSARITLYSGDTNEQSSGWMANATSGTTFTGSFNANKTIVNGIIKIEAKALSNPISIEERTSSFSVANSGIVFNEVTCTDDFTTENVTAVITIDDVASDNAVDLAVQEIHTQTGIGSRLIWIMIMGVFAAGIWWGAENMGWEGKSTLGMIVVAEVLLIIVGAILGYIGFGIVVLVTLAGILVAGIAMRSMFTGTGG